MVVKGVGLARIQVGSGCCAQTEATSCGCDIQLDLAGVAVTGGNRDVRGDGVSGVESEVGEVTSGYAGTESDR